MKDEFDSRISSLPYDLVCLFQKEHQSVELNNIIDGFESDFYTILLSDDDENLNEYSLIYIGNDNGIRGLNFKSGRKIKDRDIYTFRFCQAIEAEFPNKNSLVVFNTFQSQLKRVYENFGIICIPEHIAHLKNGLVFLMPNNKKDVDRILQVDFLEFYRSYFNRKNKKQDSNELAKVYLMYDQKEGYFKIGETKNKLKTRRKGVSEATLRATNPMIEIICAWEATKKLETELHANYKSKRKRGEWFDLRAIDLEDINKMTLKYNTIDLINNVS
jgi:hypothetical protein